MKSRILQCLNACASEFHEEKNIVKRDGKYLKKGCLDEIIKRQKRNFNLSASIKIDKEAIRSRYYWGNLAVMTMGPVSPMVAVEPQLVGLILRMSRICRCLTATQCLLLANDLIKAPSMKMKSLLSRKRDTNGNLTMQIWVRITGMGSKKDGSIH